MDSLNSSPSETAAPDPRDQLRRFVDTLPWCVDFDLALTQFVRLAVEALGLGSLGVYVQNLEVDGYSLRKSITDERPQSLECDAAIVQFFQDSGLSSLSVESPPSDVGESESGPAARAQLKSLRAVRTPTPATRLACRVWFR